MHFNGKLSWLSLLRQSKKRRAIISKTRSWAPVIHPCQRIGQPSILFIRYSETVGNNLLQNKIQDTNRSARQRI